MTDSGKENFEDFTAKIDSAIDQLFTPKRKVEIDPLTNELKTQPQESETPVTSFSEEGYAREVSSTPAAPAAPTAPTAANTNKKPSTPPAKQPTPDINSLLSQLDQNFLSIDWEVNSKAIFSFKESLAALKKIFPKKNNPDLFNVMLQMDLVLNAMGTAPEKLPASAVKSLQKGIILLKDYVKNNDADDKSFIKAAHFLTRELQNVIAPPTTKEDEPQEQITKSKAPLTLPEFGDDLLASNLIPEIQESRIPQELSNQLNLHLTILAQCINRILPLEKLFAQNELYGKYLNEHQEIRVSLEEEKDVLASALSADYSSSPLIPGSNIPADLAKAVKKHIKTLDDCLKIIIPTEQIAKKKGAEKLYRVEREIRRQLESQKDLLQKNLTGRPSNLKTDTSNVSGDLRKIFESHVDSIGKTIKQVVPLENLFGKTKGYEKLHAVQKRVRVQLEVQRKLLAEALISHRAPTPLSPSQSRQPQPPPWQKLLKGQWQGQNIAFLPEEIVYSESHKAIKKIINPASFALVLKRLKKWPWSKLKPIFSGELGRMQERQLSAMEIPRLNHIKAFGDSGNDNGVITILYNNGISAYALLDNEPEDFHINQQNWQWHPVECVEKESLLLSGFLTNDNESIAVVSLMAQ